MRQKERILLVDDETDLGELISKRIRSNGYEVFYQPSSTGAVKAALEVRPHLIVLDLKMPEMSGDEVYFALQKEERLKKIPVIFLTALLEEEKKLKERIPGAKVLKKPCDPPILLAAIQQKLGHLS